MKGATTARAGQMRGHDGRKEDSLTLIQVILLLLALGSAAGSSVHLVREAAQETAATTLLLGLFGDRGRGGVGYMLSLLGVAAAAESCFDGVHAS